MTKPAKTSQPRQREHVLVGVLSKLPVKDRKQAYYVTLGLGAALVLVGLCVAPNATALGLPSLGVIAWVRSLFGR